MLTTHFQPGNMTRYTISQSANDHYHIFVWWNNGGGGAAIRIPATDNAVHHSYVAEKLRANEEDAKCIAYFITSALGGEIFDQDLPRCIREKDVEK